MGIKHRYSGSTEQHPERVIKPAEGCPLPGAGCRRPGSHVKEVTISTDCEPLNLCEDRCGQTLGAFKEPTSVW